MRVRILRLPGSEELPLPVPASPGSSGVDLRATADFVLAPGERAAVPTGLALEIPAGWEGQVRPRSGLAIRHGVTVANAPGTIDSDYRGEVKVLLVNLGPAAFAVRRGDRIAQLVLAAVEPIEWDEADALEASGRGDGGFGSTGLG